MSKNRNKTEVSAPKKNRKVTVTGDRKAHKVLQSNGLHYFKTWAETTSSGGRRPNSARPAFKSSNPALYRKLVAKGEGLNRRMDNPPVPKEQAQTSKSSAPIEAFDG